MFGYRRGKFGQFVDKIVIIRRSIYIGKFIFSMRGTEPFTNILQSVGILNKQLLKRFGFIMGIMSCIF